MLPSFCGGCQETLIDEKCNGSLRRRGLQKAHWECWSECNLACPFCFRTRGRPLETDNAILLLRALRTGGLRTVVFAGGDPSIRSDLLTVAREGRALGLAIHIQTNAHHVNSRFMSALKLSEHVGLSLDGPDSRSHDAFRQKQGNFRRVLSLLNELERLGIPVSVRTVISALNYRQVPELGDLLSSYSNLVHWTLLEFTPIGEGYVNRNMYLMSTRNFEQTIEAARNRFAPEKLDVFRNSEKVGTYMMISPDGMVYGTTEAALTKTGWHQYVGSVLSDHLSDLSAKLPISSTRHGRRYDWQLESVRVRRDPPLVT
jgi:MoaA/NifB/PqqE/SkfB family radical SAM enzyme